MAKFLESEKRRISLYYVKALYAFYDNGILDESDMDILVEDIEIISEMTKKKEWKDLVFITNRFSLPPEEVLALFKKIVFVELKSDYSKKWFEEIILRNHFTVIDTIVKEFLKHVILLDVEVPDYISITPERRLKIYSFVKQFYKEKILNNGKNNFIKLHFRKVKPVSQFVDQDEDYKALANQIFDFEINIIEKNLLTV